MTHKEIVENQNTIFTQLLQVETLSSSAFLELKYVMMNFSNEAKKLLILVNIT